MLPLFLCREFVGLIPWCLHFYTGNFFYTSQPAFIFMRVVSLTYPMQASFYAGSFSYTSHADFIFMWGVCLTHPVLASCLCGEFLLHLPYWLLIIYFFNSGPPPLEGTSLHRRNISVERPWGILSLFTTCLPLWVKSSHQSRCHTSPTQELIACILRRQSSPIYGVLERTVPERKKAREKKTHEKAPSKLRKMSP